jgi:hypothetical protein
MECGGSIKIQEKSHSVNGVSLRYITDFPLPVVHRLCDARHIVLLRPMQTYSACHFCQQELSDFLGEYITSRRINFSEYRKRICRDCQRVCA